MVIYSYSRKSLAEVYEQKKRANISEVQCKKDVVSFLASHFSLHNDPAAIEIITKKLNSGFFSKYNDRLKIFRRQHKRTEELLKETWFQSDFSFEIKDCRQECHDPPPVSGKSS